MCEASARRLSPRVYVYEPGTPPPSLPDGAIALPQLPQRPQHAQHALAAFGDGSHPTTRLCAGAVDVMMQRSRPREVLDVGTGTGILARIARARGALAVAATDIDPAALTSAAHNAALDGHAVAIELSAAPPDHWGPRFGLVVANILEGPLCGMSAALAGALAPGGALLLSGFTPAQTPALRVAFAGLEFVSASTLAGWSLLMLRRRG